MSQNLYQVFLFFFNMNNESFFCDSLPLDCFVSILQTFRIPFCLIVTLVPHALFDSLLLDCYVNILCTFRIFFHWVVTSGFRALL